MKKVAIVRGAFLNRYEMQFFEPLVNRYDLTAFGSLHPYHDRFAFPVVKLASPMDLPDFPYKMPVLNRLFVDAHYLVGLEKRLTGFDLVHTAETYFHYTQQCLNAKKQGRVKKVIATVLENIPFNNEGIWGRRAFKQRARAELDHMIALTNKTKEAMLAEGADPNKISVISHFVDTKRFAPSPDLMKRLADQKKKRFTILFSGRLEVYKGVLDILNAIRILRHDTVLDSYEFDMVFVGVGSQLSRMQEMEKEIDGNWHFSHKSAKYDAMPTFYQKADIFVAPSSATPTWQEQYCTALLEAQAAGLPIVTTNSGGIPENVGRAALVVQPKDIAGLADALKEFILSAKKRVEYATRARQRAVTVHDIRIGAGKMDALYKRVLSS